MFSIYYAVLGFLGPENVRQSQLELQQEENTAPLTVCQVGIGKSDVFLV